VIVMNNIVLYSDKESEFCEKARQWLVDRGYAFEEKGVAEGDNLEGLFSVSGQYAVPVIVVDDKVIVGFNEKKLEELLIQ
jgi:arsenate reductase-like glutaredoxin family protein